MRSTFFVFLSTILAACGGKDNPQEPAAAILDTEQMKTEIIEAERAWTDSLRNGKIVSAIEMHLDAPEYRNIHNGDIRMYEEIHERLRSASERGLIKIEYAVKSRDFMFISAEHVLETLVATETTTVRGGGSMKSALTAITILWKKAEDVWRPAYFHASGGGREV